MHDVKVSIEGFVITAEIKELKPYKRACHFLKWAKENYPGKNFEWNLVDQAIFGFRTKRSPKSDEVERLRGSVGRMRAYWESMDWDGTVIPHRFLGVRATTSQDDYMLTSVKSKIIAKGRADRKAAEALRKVKERELKNPEAKDLFNSARGLLNEDPQVVAILKRIEDARKKK